MLTNTELLTHALPDSPMLKGVVAGAIAAAAIASTTAFAPVGVVGAAGWTVVYTVAASAVAVDVLERLGWARRPDGGRPDVSRLAGDNR